MYPRQLTRPLIWADGAYVGFRSKHSLQNKYNAHAGRELQLFFDDHQVTVAQADVGIAVDANAAAGRLSNYPLWARFIPLSFAVLQRTSITEKQIDEPKLEQFAQAAQDTNYRPARSASAAHEGQGRYTLVSASTGVSYDKQVIAGGLRDMPILRYDQLHIRGKKLDPAVDDEAVQRLIDKANPDNLQPITVVLEGKDFIVTPDIISSWMVIVINESEKKAEIQYDDGLLGLWINETLSGLGNQGSPAVVTLRDGVEIARREGVAGRVVAKDELTTHLHEAIDSNISRVEARLVTQAIATQYERTYSPTNAGLVLMISDWQKEYPGMQSSVFLRELGGHGLFVEKESTSQLFGASLYKLYMASYLLSKISDGQINPNEEVLPGKSYNQCIDDMIRVSDNACPEAILDKVGRSTLNAYTASLGLNKTNFADISTSAGDLGSFLQRLQTGNIIGAADTARLLDLMRRQIYRGGIPAGSPGASVADKVGFYGGSWHDAAIVNGPSANYVLVIMTKDASSLAVKTLAQRVAQTLNQ